MQRHHLAGVSIVLALAACGDGSGGSSVPVVSGGASPTPTPTATATATPASYTKFADLTGDRSFGTACAALQFENSSPAPVSATNFNDGLTVAYAATGQTWTVAGDFLPTLTFGPADVDATAPAPTRAYAKVVDNFTTRLTVGVPTPGGIALDYTRGLVLRAARPGSAIARQYQCVLGVPTLATDLPATSVAYTRAGVNGSATLVDAQFAIRTYAISGSTVAVAFDPATKLVTGTIRLSGILQTANGPSGSAVDLGTYVIRAPLDAAGRASFYSATLSSTDRDSQYSSLGGWFFGPQAIELGASFEIYATDAQGGRLSVLGNVIASR